MLGAAAASSLDQSLQLLLTAWNRNDNYVYNLDTIMMYLYTESIMTV